MRLRDLSIKRKVVLVTLVTSLVVVLLTCAALITYEVVTFRQGMARDMTVLADILGRNSTAALTFDSPEAADKTLSALVAEPHIIAAGLYGKDKKRFASYTRSGATHLFPDSPPSDGYEFGRNELVLSQPVVQNEERLGTLYLKADLQGMYDRIKSYALIVGLVLVVAIVVTFGLSIGVQRLISRPIMELADTARIVAERKDYSVRAKRDARDEIGVLTDAMNQMLAEIESGQSALQKANESLHAQATQVHEANRSLEAQATQITDTVGVLGASSKQILALSGQVASSATEAAAAVAQTTTTVEEVRQTAHVSSQKTLQVSESAQRVAQISQAGKKSTEETIDGMDRIRKQMGSVTDSMVRLSEQTQAISQIIAVVDDLAQQSNLLAVNAAIEAAKAGEHGRGFAVVASEVRNLAEQSKAATSQVRGILNDIQKATAAAAMATDQGSRAVEAGLKQSQLAGDSIVTLAGNVAEAAQAATQIAASSHQQLVGLEQVAQAMESIKQASMRNLDDAKQLESAAQDLRELGQRLNDLVGRYRIDGEPSERGTLQRLSQESSIR
jgi:methyl-accepting chemotaxis protein